MGVAEKNRGFEIPSTYIESETDHVALHVWTEGYKKNVSNVITHSGRFTIHA